MGSGITSSPKRTPHDEHVNKLDCSSTSLTSLWSCEFWYDCMNDEFRWHEEEAVLCWETAAPIKPLSLSLSLDALSAEKLGVPIYK